MDADFVSHLKADFPEFNFRNGRKFAFRPPKTIIIGPEEPSDKLLLLHELGHALLSHRNFETDAKRLKMELAAWNKARELADFYGVFFDEELMESELDTYRNWLDTRSRCPTCGLTCFQSPDGKYHCPKCENFT